jgi:tetratricopeptide (TPR) repeat protein
MFRCKNRVYTENPTHPYEGIISLPFSISSGDIYAKSFYMLGKIYEEQGDTAKATEHYEKFLSLWKDADPGIAEVEDARKRLSGLKSN